MSNTPASLTTPPEGYGDWLAELKGRSLPSIDQIERELAADDGTSMEEDS